MKTNLDKSKLKTKPNYNSNVVWINNLGYVKGPDVTNATIAIEVSTETKARLSSWPAGKLWKYNTEINDFELVNSFSETDYRLLRATECFPIVNRGIVWYNTLTSEQKEELNNWYQAWLDVTETLEIPQKPTWL